MNLKCCHYHKYYIIAPFLNPFNEIKSLIEYLFLNKFSTENFTFPIQKLVLYVKLNLKLLSIP